MDEIIPLLDAAAARQERVELRVSGPHELDALALQDALLAVRGLILGEGCPNRDVFCVCVFFNIKILDRLLHLVARCVVDEDQRLAQKKKAPTVMGFRILQRPVL